MAGYGWLEPANYLFSTQRSIALCAVYEKQFGQDGAYGKQSPKFVFRNSSFRLRTVLFNEFRVHMSLQSFLTDLRRRAAACSASVVLADSFDPRTLQAASQLIEQNIATPWLIGSSSALHKAAEETGVSLEGAVVFDWERADQAEFVSRYYTKRAHKGMSHEEAAKVVTDPLLLGGLLLDRDEVDACVAGSLSSTAAVLRAALHTIALAEGVRTLSSYFLMVFEERVLAYADCAVVPEPSAEQLCDIARSTAANYARISEQEARVAFLSFSTMGSAEHESITGIREALRLFHEREPMIVADGEMQADAALVASVASRKAPKSSIQGDATVLIFPNLHAGNIAYKLSERLGGAVALGPIVQGLSKPYCDLSRGCSVEDIVNTACISILMSTKASNAKP